MGRSPSKPWTSALLIPLLVLAGLASARSAHALPPPILTGYVPLPAQDLYDAFETVNSAANTTINFSLGITNAASGAIIVYDHWEDGYEADLTNPTQATTLVFGDGNLANGDAAVFCATCAGDLLPAGAALVMRNNVDVSPRDPSVIRFDGSDKVASTRAFAITTAAFPTGPGSLFGDAAAAYDTTRYGTSFVVPIGQDTPTPAGSSPAFEYTGLSIMASADGTVVQVDKDNNGSFETTATINEGQTLLVNGGVLQGARITTSKPAQVVLLTGDVGAAYEMRFMELYPTSLSSNDYVNPVGSFTANQETIIYLWNPNPSPIIVTPTCTGCAVTIGLCANCGISFTVPLGQGVRFTSDGLPFQAIGAMGSRSGAGGGGDGTATYDWGFSLVPTPVLTWQAVVGFAPGDSAVPITNATYSPVWVTTLVDTTLYVDFDGNPVTGAFDTPAGCGLTGKYDLAIPVTALTSTRITDPSDKDMSGARIFTCDRAKIAGAWGEDPSTAPAGAPGFDAGWTLFPTTWMVVDKTAALGTDVNGDGLFGPGDTIEYSVKIANAGFSDLTQVVLEDTLPAGVSYVAGSSVLVQGATTTPIPDAGATPFPFDEGGSLLPDPDLAPGESYIVQFSVVIDSPYTGPADLRLVNAGTVTSVEDSGFDQVDTPVVLPEPPVCKQDAARSKLLTRTVDTTRPVGGGDGDPGNPINYHHVEAAYDAAKVSPGTRAEVIGLFSTTTENLVLDDYTAKSMTLTQCASAQVTAANPGLPVWRLTATRKLLIIGADSVGGTFGWELVTGGHELKGIRANNASVAGVRISSNSNAVSWNAIAGNAIGLDVLGKSNTLKGSAIGPNAGAGVHFGPAASGNTLSGTTIRDNAGNGVWLEGSSNKVQSSKVLRNVPNGFLVSGAGNSILSNTIDANSGDGVYVTGTNNLFKGNKVSKNNDDGFDISGSGNRLASNASNNGGSGGSSENGGYEYRLTVGAVNLGGNKADGIRIPKTSAPQKCPTFPAAGLCE
jgi:uncharacterized repeat protein (TIGR01451 family)